MKKIILILALLSLGLALYFGWPSKEEPILSTEKPEKLKTPIIAEEKKPISTPTQIIPSKKPIKDKKIKGFSATEKNIYFKKIKDTIKDQWKELEDCENEFDLHFDELMAMGPKQTMDYLSDANNLENFLEKFSSFNMTTPSSAKMIRLLAEPIASDVDRKEIIDTVGFVKTCKAREKSNLLWAIHNLKNKNQATAQATIAFLENENSTLTYPDILYQQIWDIKTFLDDYGIDKSTLPEIAQIEKDYSDYGRRLTKIYETRTPEESGTFDPKTHKESFEFAIQLQSKIQLLLKKLKEKFI